MLRAGTKAKCMYFKHVRQDKVRTRGALKDRLILRQWRVKFLEDRLKSGSFLRLTWPNYARCMNGETEDRKTHH